MRGPWRLPVLAAALNLFMGAGLAAAQTVIVRHAPAGAAIEVTVNDETAASATADETGTAKLTVKMPGGKVETDAEMHVDVCDNVRRLVLFERTFVPSSPAPGCRRTELERLFLLRPITTLLVDLSEPAHLWIRQGSVPDEWLSDAPIVERTWRPSPTGVVLSGGGAMTSIRDASVIACGTAECDQRDASGLKYSVGIDWWVARFFALEVGFTKPADMRATGSGAGYRFESGLDTQMITTGVKIGVPIGPVRPYGRAAANRNRTITTTSQTTDTVTVVVNGVEQTFPGGTQNYEFRTTGWGWLFGGGVEVWVTNSFAFYAEGGAAKLKGDAIGNVEFAIDDRASFMLFGARFRLGL